ncbi:MAG: hypothetical protein HRT72_10140, partial [Flavobacteriales bacterium]|nr:hypothetical protein [Flavobacteriales bacterium]
MSTNLTYLLLPIALIFSSSLYAQESEKQFFPENSIIGVSTEARSYFSSFSDFTESFSFTKVIGNRLEIILNPYGHSKNNNDDWNRQSETILGTYLGLN